MRAVKVPRLEGGSTGPRTESWVKFDGPMAMEPCLHQGNISTKRKLRVWRDQNCILLVGAITPLTCASHQNNQSRGRQYRAQNGKLGKLGLTYGHGTVFAPREYSFLVPIAFSHKVVCLPCIAKIMAKVIWLRECS